MIFSQPEPLLPCPDIVESNILAFDVKTSMNVLQGLAESCDINIGVWW